MPISAYIVSAMARAATTADAFNAVAEIDLRPGGRWRYVAVADGGMEVGFHGEYREIVPNERVVSTEAYEGIPDPDANATLNTATFTEADGRTTLTILRSGSTGATHRKASSLVR